ncbi:MAG: hypothetical protein M1829_005053 [Trizodia sp. TS-e1964]|nr:MAG: hypothetical protein M1829_005053 [Trizodia sp. TS-e1964]
MSDSGLSSPLSSAPSTDDESFLQVTRDPGMLKFLNLKKSADTPPAKLGSSPSQKKRAASPPHEYVLADNPDIAFIVMFRSRFSPAFTKTLPHYGPQDIERGVVDTIPGEQVESLLCALLGLVLNRKKPVEKGHYQRALEEAIHSHSSQWPRAWNHANPLAGGKTFNAMSPTERLTMLKSLIIWSLHSSEAIQAIIKDSYKQSRHDDDLNQPLSVQPWGRDGDKRRYWLIEGQDDTYFRLYRESKPELKNNTWFSVAGTIDELKAVAQKLNDEGSQAARRLGEKILSAVPRFEANEEKRKRREYRQTRKQQFVRPDPGFSLYEGRTRGKRIKYTINSESDSELENKAEGEISGGSDGAANRRSTRHSGISTPISTDGPVFTASGRQVRPRVAGAFPESSSASRRNSHQWSGYNTGLATPVQVDENGQSLNPENGPLITLTEDALNGTETIHGSRSKRSGLRQESRGIKPIKAKAGNHIEGYNSLDEMDEEEDAASSGADWDAEDDDAEIGSDDDDDDQAFSDDENDNDDLMDLDMQPERESSGPGRKPGIAGSRSRPRDGPDKNKTLVVQLRYNSKSREGNLPTALPEDQTLKTAPAALPTPPGATLEVPSVYPVAMSTS